MKSLIKIGTRGSKLALYQAEVVGAKLKTLFPLLAVENVKIHTSGDMLRKGAIASMGPGIFTREIEESLLKKEIDLAVHSAKDLATELPAGLEIGAVLEREDARDCLVARDGKTLSTLSEGARVGTSSLRRRAQLRHLRQDLTLVEMRGNIDSRLKKVLEHKDCEAIVVAHAGLKRLGLANLVTEIFEEEKILPQAGQGAIAVQIRSGDIETGEIVRTMNHRETSICVSAERSFLGRLEGGCQVPAGVSANLEGDLITLCGAIFSLDGDRVISDVLSASLEKAKEAGVLLADKILNAGGREILSRIRNVDKS